MEPRKITQPLSKFTLNADQSIERVISDDVATKQIRLGGDKADEFLPEVKISQDNSVLKISSLGQYATVEQKDGQIVFKNSGEELRVYEKQVDGHDAMEIELHLPTKPATNRFDFKLETKGLQFFKQLPLTEEEISNGAIRPAHVENSLVVMTQPASNRVEPKKIAHIYRPHIVDALGNEVWGDLEIDTAAGILTVIVPEKYLESATYPVIVDPTIGYTSVGATSLVIGNATNSTFRGQTYFVGAETKLTTLTVYLSSTITGNFNAKVAIFEKDSISTFTHGLISQDERLNLTKTAGWYTFTFSGTVTLLPGRTYILGVIAQSGAGGDSLTYYDTVGPNSQLDGTITYNPLASSFFDCGLSAGRLSIYSDTATYSSFDVDLGAATSTGFDVQLSRVATFPLIQTLTDNFNDNSFNTSLWTSYGNGTVLEQNQRLEITGVELTVSNTGLYADLNYNLIGSFLSWEMHSLVLYTNSSYYGGIYTPTDEHIIFGVTGTTLSAIYRKNGVDTTQATTTYNATNHRWFRIREASGTVFWETSADGVTWNAFTSVANPISLLWVWTEQFLSYTNPSTQPSFILDNINTLQVSVFDTLGITENIATSVVGGGGPLTVSVSDTLAITENVARSRTAQAISFLNDDFNDNNLSAATWLNWGGAEVVNTNQRLEISVLSGGANYQGMETIGTYDLTGSEARIAILDAGNQALASLEVSFSVRQDTANTVFLLVSGNNLIAYRKVSGVNQYITQVAYTASTVKYIRFRELSGTLYWEYSANGHSWTTLHSETSPITVSAVGLEIVAGVYATEATGTTVIFDNLNIFAFEFSDSVAITENVTPLRILNQSVSDTLTLTENVTLLRSVDQSVFDAVAITESVTAERITGALTVSVFDALTITEAVTLLETSFVSAVDTLTITESVTLLNTITQVTFDAVAITENVATTFVGAGFSTSVFDAVGITEAVTLLETSFVSVFDAVGITESVTTLLVANQSVSDQLTISESVTAVLTLSQSVNDALGISESVTVLRVANQSVFDAVGIAESVTTERSTIASVFDALTISESVAAQLGTINVSVFDAVGIAESVAAVIEGGGFASTDVSITENVTLQLIQTTYPISVSDTIAISEATTQENNIFVESKLERKFPKVRATALSSNSANVSIDVTLPTGYQVGDLLIIAVAVSGTNIGMATPSGWTAIATTGALSFAYWKIADGSEGTFVDVGNLLVRRYAAVSYAIYDYTGATPIEGVGTTGLNAPSLDPSWSETIDALWIAIATTQGTDGAFSAAPTGFDNLLIRESIDGVAGTSQATIATARKEDTSVTLDPDSFTHSGPLVSETTRTFAVSGDVGVSQGVTQVGITESVTSSVTLSVSVADTLAITESVVPALTLSQSVADTLAITEAITTALTANLSVNDPIGITEFVSPNAVYTAVVSDALTITDDAAALRVLTASVSDTVGITEAVTTNITRNVVTFDAVTISEAVTADSSFQVSVFDALTITENVQRLFTASTSVSDTLVITEDITSAVTRFASVNTAIAITETVLPQRVHLASVFDALTITESQAFRLEATYTANVFELISIIEAISNEVNTQTSVNDQIIITENVNPNKIFNAQLIWDSIVMADVVTDRETIRFSPEPQKYRPRGLRGDIKQRGRGTSIIKQPWSGSGERISARGSVKSR